MTELATDAPRRPRWKRILRLVVFLLVLASPFWVRALAMEMDYFRVRRVEIVGTRYIAPSSLLELLALDSTASVWARLGPLGERVATHRQVGEVRVRRKLPGTLILEVRENLPVALVESPEGLIAYDGDARVLPIDPSRTAVDVPVLARRDSSALRLLDDLRLFEPPLYARISDVRWDERGGMRVLLTGLLVRATAGTTAERFAEILPVEQDLARRGVRARELDLRYRDQIVARIE
jgi:cell division protein FtsQ